VPLVQFEAATLPTFVLEPLLGAPMVDEVDGCCEDCDELNVLVVLMIACKHKVIIVY
jgi:hypothetical protein